MWKTFKASFDSPDSYVSLALGLAVVLVVGMIAFNYFKAKMQPVKTAEEQKQEQTQTTKTSLPTTYTVKDGDTLWSIAESYYSSGYNWVDIQKANSLVNADVIDAGQTLTIPDVKPIAVPAGEISAVSATTSLQHKSYTVVADDSLWSIAVNQYGDGYKWTEIAQTNHLANPDVIYAGNVIILP